MMNSTLNCFMDSYYGRALIAYSIWLRTHYGCALNTDIIYSGCMAQKRIRNELFLMRLISPGAPLIRNFSASHLIFR